MPETALAYGLLTPPIVVLAVAAGVALTTLYALWRGRRDGMDGFQERAFVGRTHVPLLRRAVWLAVEGFWQNVAFFLQGWHLVVGFRNPRLVRGGPPLILLPGYLENSGQMWLLGRRLRARGYQVVLQDHPSTLHAIDRNADALAARVREVLEATGAERVGLVAHSMGGMVSRAYVRRCLAAGETPPVATVCSIASPHRGTHLARLGIGASARDMSPGSEWLARNRHGARGPVPIHTVIPVQDNIVSPSWSTVLAEGEDVVLDVPVGHVAPLFLRRVEVLVARWLAEAGHAPQARDAVAAPLAAAHS